MRPNTPDRAGGAAPDGDGTAMDGAPAEAAGVALDASALAVARSAAELESGDPALVGDVVDVYAEDAIAVTARFQAPVPGYRGWLWSVTVALLSGGDAGPGGAGGHAEPGAPRVSCTVSEVVLLPGPDALLAPPWVPWEQRIRSGDLGVGDLLPPAPDDPRLVPAYVQSDDPEVERVATELGLGRVRVLSREGRLDAAERWHQGAFGPDDDMAVHAPGHCASCAFYLPLAGLLGGGFGACGNEFSPADGRVVDVAYGCGAHSEAIGTGPARSAASGAVIDEMVLEVHRHEAAAELADGADGDGTGGTGGTGAAAELADGADGDGAADDGTPASADLPADTE